jgi:hypothetical protein
LSDSFNRSSESYCKATVITGEEDNICLERWNQGQVEVLFFVLLLGELKVICI